MLNCRSITVIIPALNEEGSIGRVIRDIPECVDRVLVADNGSMDQTRTKALEAGADVISVPEKGYGNACQAGVSVAADADILAFMDGDYSDYPEDLLPLLESVAEGRCDFCMGYRCVFQSGRASALQWYQRWGNGVACQLIWLLYGFRYFDLGPMRCIRRDCLERLDMHDKSYGWTAEMQIRAALDGIRILQMPVRYRQRIGVSKISGTLIGALTAGYGILFWTIRLIFSRWSFRGHEKQAFRP